MFICPSVYTVMTLANCRAANRSVLKLKDGKNRSFLMLRDKQIYMFVGMYHGVKTINDTVDDKSSYSLFLFKIL